ncbi:MAG: ribosomal protein S18-alanine N-acetyltransferase [Gammaproteobacteria bacterium]|nr:ribosomal protein S18-alanine N-acetyltransferase [Gammaproteobacteria bacterium]
MCRDDLAAVMVVERLAHPYPWTPGVMAGCLRNGYYCALMELTEQPDKAPGSEIIGYGVMSRGGGEAHIQNLCIIPPRQRQGLGRKLLQHLLDQLDPARVDSVFLEVRSSNRAALTLYDEMGFRETGLREGYYPTAKGREDAVVLWRDVRGSWG